MNAEIVRVKSELATREREFVEKEEELISHTQSVPEALQARVCKSREKQKNRQK